MINFPLNTKTGFDNADYYDQLWQSYGKNLRDDEIIRIQFIVDNLKKYIKSGNLQILDLGCGRGWMTPFLAPFGTITAIDFSQVGIDFARSNYNKYAQFVLADSSSDTLGLQANLKFDVIVNSEVIEHVPNHSAYIEHIFKLLKPNGWLFLTTPNGNVWPDFSAIEKYQREFQPIENWITTETLKKILIQKGFKIYLHEGRAEFGFRIGLSGNLQYKIIWKIFRILGFESLYFKLILPTALYQMVVAKKIKSELSVH